jgi:hypothetical protein
MEKRRKFTREFKLEAVRPNMLEVPVVPLTGGGRIKQVLFEPIAAATWSHGVQSTFPSRRRCYLVFAGGCCRRGTTEGGMSRATLDNRHRNKDGEISVKHGNTLLRTLRKLYGQSFAAGYPDSEKLGEVLLKLNETSLSQLRRDHETGHLDHKITKASK